MRRQWLLCVLLVGLCGACEGGGDATCEYGGRVYAVGDRAYAQPGCPSQECTCTEQGWDCWHCHDAGPVGEDVADGADVPLGPEEAWRRALAEDAACDALGGRHDRPLPPPRQVSYCGERLTFSEATLALEGDGAEGLDPAVDVLPRLDDWGLAPDPESAALRLRLGDLDDFGVPEALSLAGDEAYVLALRKRSDGGAAALLLARTPVGRGRALDRLAQLLAPDGPRWRATETTIADAPAVPLRVMIEGFYGPPWAHAARLDLVRFAGRAWLNAYLLAAKHDPANVLLWDQPLSESRLRQMDELVAAGREAGVRLYVAISPGHSVEFGSEADRAAAVARFTQLHEHGVDGFVLAFDDVPKELRGADPATYASYAEGQAAFVADVFARTRALTGEGTHFVFVPNDYWTESAAASGDLATVTAALPDDVDVAWTGPQVCSPAITAADAAAFAAIAGRPPVLGDNDLAKDGDIFSGSLAYGPLAPRPAALAAELRGFGANLMPLPFASLPGLWSAASWAWNPHDYDPDAALLGAGATGLPTTLAPYATWLCPDGPRAPGFPYAVDFASCRDAMNQDHNQIRAVCDALAVETWTEERALDELVQGGWPGDLASELRPWATTLARCASLARQAVQLGIQPTLGTRPPTADVDALEAAWQSECLAAPAHLDLGAFDDLVRAALSYARVGI